MVYFTRQRFARAIIDAETLRSLFVNISRIFGISRRTSCILFPMHTDERNLSLATLRNKDEYFMITIGLFILKT